MAPSLSSSLLAMRSMHGPRRPAQLDILHQGQGFDLDGGVQRDGLLPRQEVQCRAQPVGNALEVFEGDGSSTMIRQRLPSQAGIQPAHDVVPMPGRGTVPLTMDKAISSSPQPVAGRRCAGGPTGPRQRTGAPDEVLAHALAPATSWPHSPPGLRIPKRRLREDTQANFDEACRAGIWFQFECDASGEPRAHAKLHRPARPRGLTLLSCATLAHRSARG